MNKFKATLRFILGFIIMWPVIPVSFLGIILYCIFHVLHMEKVAETLSHGLFILVCFWIIFCLGGRMHIEGLENVPSKDKAVVFAPNHCSITDVPFIFWALKRFPSMMAKKELFRVPLVHGLLLSLKCIKIDRKSAHGALGAVHKGMERVKAGDSIVVFPEGTRSKTGVIGPFKSGAFRIAASAGAPIVPVVLKNNRYILEGGSHFRPVDIYIKFLPPVETAGLDLEAIKELGPQVRETIEENYNTYPAFRTAHN